MYPIASRTAYTTTDQVRYYNQQSAYQRVPATVLVEQPINPEARTPENFNVSDKFDEDLEGKNPDIKVDLAPSIYSAGTIVGAYFAAVFASFMAQSFILYLFISEEKLTFKSSIGYDTEVFLQSVFKRALGRFICFVMILLKGQEDLQNALDLIFSIHKMGTICGILQLLVSFCLPVAFVYSISISEGSFTDITKTGLLLVFIDLDSHVYKLVLMGKKKAAAEGVRKLKVVCKCNCLRTWVRGIALPLYMFGFFFIAWYAAMEQYPLAFVFFLCTFGVFLTPYFD